MALALGPLGANADGDAFGQFAPAVDLLHGLDVDALAYRQQVELGEVGVGDVAQATFRAGKQAQDALVVNIGGADLPGRTGARQKHDIPTNRHISGSIPSRT